MNIEQAIYQILKTDSGITARVAGRIFAGVAPQQVHDDEYLVYRSAGDRRIVRTLEGGCALFSQRMHVFSTGKKYGRAATLDDLVILTLDEFRNTVTLPDTSPSETLFIESIFLTPLSHEYQYVDKTERHEFISEFDCHYLDPSRAD